MKKLLGFISLFLLMFVVLNVNVNAQQFTRIGGTVILCEHYDSHLGPVGVGNSFSTGYLTVVLNLPSAMNFKSVYIQYDRQNTDGSFSFYKGFTYTWPVGNWTVVYFTRSANNSLSFDIPGYYTVYVLDAYNKSVILGQTTVTITNRP